MTSEQLQTLLDDSACAQCYVGLSVPQLIKLALLNRVSQLYPAFSFIQRSGITDATQIAAINELVLSANEHGWWDKCDLIYPFVGGTALAHAQNLKSSNFTITWVGGVTHDANGITGDGTTGFGDTAYVCSSSGQMAQNSVHLGVYRRTLGSLIGFQFYTGSSSPSTQVVIRQNAASSYTVQLPMSDNAIDPFTLTSLAFLIGTRTDATTKHVFTADQDKVATRASIGIPALALYVCARNNNGVYGSPTNANISGLTAGSGITFSEYQLMSSDWQTFQTALGRQV